MRRTKEQKFIIARFKGVSVLKRTKAKPHFFHTTFGLKSKRLNVDRSKNFLLFVGGKLPSDYNP
jgi:hypothetical protein